MRFQIILMFAAIVVAVIVLLSSRFARTVFKEAILRPRHHCDIEVQGDKVSVKTSPRPTEIGGPSHDASIKSSIRRR
jgi:hypothetical protein